MGSSQDNIEHHIGMAIENDYRWDCMGFDGQTYLFIGNEIDLPTLETPTVDEYLKRDTSQLPMSSALRERIRLLNNLAHETKSAALQGDMGTIRRNYNRFGALTQNVPYDADVVLRDWKKEGFISGNS